MGLIRLLPRPGGSPPAPAPEAEPAHVERIERAPEINRRTHGVSEGVGDRRPFRLPSACAAFVLLRHSRENDRHGSDRELGGGDGVRGVDRVSLLRHRGRRSLPRRGTLPHLANFRLGHQHEVSRDLRDDAGGDA